MLSAPDDRRVGRAGRGVAVELRPATEPLSAEELRRREAELERLIVKAACRRAARLAAGLAGGPGRVDGRVPEQRE